MRYSSWYYMHMLLNVKHHIGLGFMYIFGSLDLKYSFKIFPIFHNKYLMFIKKFIWRKFLFFSDFFLYTTYECQICIFAQYNNKCICMFYIWQLCQEPPWCWAARQCPSPSLEVKSTLVYLVLINGEWLTYLLIYSTPNTHSWVLSMATMKIRLDSA